MWGCLKQVHAAASTLEWCVWPSLPRHGGGVWEWHFKSALAERSDRGDIIHLVLTLLTHSGWVYPIQQHQQRNFENPTVASKQVRRGDSELFEELYYSLLLGPSWDGLSTIWDNILIRILVNTNYDFIRWLIRGFWTLLKFILKNCSIGKESNRPKKTSWLGMILKCSTTWNPFVKSLCGGFVKTASKHLR